jgi:hypothetical protein
MMPYPSFSDPRHLGMTYSIDGIMVPRDYFISTVEAHFHGSLGFALLEMSAQASRPRLLESRVYYPSGQLEGKYAPADARLAVAMAFEYHGTLERDWLVTDNWSAALNILGGTQPLIDPQNSLTTRQTTFVQNGIHRASALGNNHRCREFINAILQRAASVIEARWWATSEKYVSTNGVFGGVGITTALSSYQHALDQGWITASGDSGDHQGSITYGTTRPASHYSVSWNNEFFNLSQDEAGLNSLHEALHQFPGFDDQTLASAASYVDSHGRSQNSYDPGVNGITSASQDLNSYIRRYCAP